MNKPVRVVIETETVGQCFGTRAVIRSVATDRVLARTETVRPYGFGAAAMADGRALADSRGYTEVGATDLEVRS